MPKRALAVVVAFALAAGPAAGFSSAEEPAAAADARLKTAGDVLRGHFEAVTLAALDDADLRRTMESAPPSGDAAAAWQRYAAAARAYDELRAGLANARPDEVVARVRAVSGLLGLGGDDADRLVPRYQAFQNELIAAKARWAVDRYVGPDGKPFSPESWKRFSSRAAPDLTEREQAFAQRSQELVAIRDLAKSGRSSEAAQRLGTLLDGLGQRKDLLDQGFGTAPMQTTLALVQWTRDALPTADRRAVDAKMPTIDRQLRAIAQHRLAVPEIAKTAGRPAPKADDAKQGELAFYASLSALPGVSGWAKEKLWQTQAAALLAKDPRVASFKPTTKDPWGGARAGLQIVYKDGSRRYESIDGASRMVSTDGKRIVDADPKKGSFTEAVDGQEIVHWERDRKTGRVVGRFHGMPFDAAPDQLIVLTPDGDKLVVAKGYDKQHRPIVVSWLGWSRRERGRVVPGLGQIVTHFADGTPHEDAYLESALAARFAAGERVDLTKLGLKRASAESLSKMSDFLRDLPQFGALFASSMRGEKTKSGSRWIESMYIRDGQLHLAFAEKGGAGSSPSYMQMVAVVDQDASGSTLKAFLTMDHSTFMWKFPGDGRTCDEFRQDVEQQMAGKVAFELARRYVNQGGRWTMTQNIPAHVREWTTWDTVKTMGGATLGAVGSATEVVFSPFQTALYGIEGTLLLGGGAAAVALNPDGAGEFAKVSGVYTLRQAKFNEYLGQGTQATKRADGTMDDGQVMDAYAQANQVVGAQGRTDLKNLMNDEVDKMRRAQYGELYRFHRDDPISEKDRAYAAARVFGLGNLAGQYFQQGREDWEGGRKGVAALKYGAGIFVVGGEAFVEGAGFGAATAPLKTLAVAGRTGQSVEQVSVAMARSAEGLELTTAQRAAVGTMKTIGRAELAVFLAPAAGSGVADVGGLVTSWSRGDKDGVWASVEGLARNVGGFGVGTGLGFGQAMTQKRVEDFLALQKGRSAPLPLKEGIPPSSPPKLELPNAESPSARDLLTKLEVQDPAKADAARKALETDAMTGAPNRAYVDRVAPAKIAEVRAKGGEPTVAMMDMNNFGAVNDGLAALHGPTGGAARADGILVKAAARLRGLAGQYGVEMGRYGGEEFVLVGDKAAVHKFLDAARAEFADGQALRDAGLTAEESAAIQEAAAKKGRGDQSIGDFTTGVAPAKAGVGFSETLHSADEALNYAKQNGGRGLAFAPGEKAGAPAFEATPAALSGPEALEARALKALRDRRASERAPTVEERMEQLRTQLGPEGFAEFSRVAFRDGLTGARTKEFVEANGAAWKRKYPEGTSAAMVSARGLKMINDALGHEAGDAYLKALGRVVRDAASGGRLEDPVRYASKDFLFVGEGADAAAAKAAEAMRGLMAGEGVLGAAQKAKLAEWAKANGQEVPADLGTLRAVSAGSGDAGLAPKIRAASNPVGPVVDELVRRLDDAKKEEQGGGTLPPPPLQKTLKPTDLRAPELADPRLAPPETGAEDAGDRRSPHPRHRAERVDQRSAPKTDNTVVESWVPMVEHANALNMGEGVHEVGGKRYEVKVETGQSGKTFVLTELGAEPRTWRYGVHDTRYHPIDGPGMHYLTRRQYQALGMFNQLGVEKATAIMDKMRDPISAEDRAAALAVWKAVQAAK